MKRLIGGAAIIAIAALLFLGFAHELSANECEPEPASPWAPAGWICPPMHGEGIASQWPGPGVARNDCVWPWTDCAPIRIISLEPDSYGNRIEVRPTMWCHCWVGVTGPLGETARIVDLDPAAVAALGLDPSRGLHRVRVEPVAGSVPEQEPEQETVPTSEQMMPDTAMNDR